MGLKSGNTLPILGDFLFGGKKRTPAIEIPVLDPRETWSRAPSSALRATWLGHSTVLLEIDGARVLTDPVFGERASPVSFAGPKRFHRPPVRIDQLPALDLVVLSHDHYDHLCASSIRELVASGAPLVTSLGVGAHLEALGFPSERIHELDWWERTRIGGIDVMATPSRHFSGRGVGDRNRTLWSSWVLEGESQRVFFSGDTGLTPDFEEIARRTGRFDLTLLEIGAFNEAWGDIHLGPDHAITAFRMLGGGTLLPVHWGTFDLGLHAWDEPAEILAGYMDDLRIAMPRLGEAFEPHLDIPIDAWWRAERELRAAE